MERLGRPGDDFRQLLTPADIRRICRRHELPPPEHIAAESRGNEKVVYYLDDRIVLAFVLSEDVKTNVEALQILELIEAMPTPPVLAWSADDPVLHVPYMLTERCPGVRLDDLWGRSLPEERIRILEALGEGMGKYHTVRETDVRTVAERLYLSQRVHCPDRCLSPRRRECLDGLENRLRRQGIEPASSLALLERHYKTNLSEPIALFTETGLIHDEPEAEHRFLAKMKNGYRLSGCVDFGGVTIADSLGEIAVLYDEILGADDAYYAAFKRGYERHFRFPPDAEIRIRHAAIDFQMDAVLFLVDKMENAGWGWAKGWLGAHWERLRGWLDPSARQSRARFRRDIGPY